MRIQLSCMLAMGLLACGTTPRGDDAGDDDGNSGTVTKVSLPQALGGAMFANPDAYQTIPVHVVVDTSMGDAPGVTVSVDKAEVAAIPDPSGGWTAQVPIATLEDGQHELVASSGGVDATVLLVIGRQGMQWTRISVDGNAGTPRLFRVDDHMYITWTDVTGGHRTAWKQEVDGAGRRIGTQVAIAGGGTKPDVLYARTAFGASTIGVVYQQQGGPYASFFTIVDMDGNEKLAPIALDPAGRFGSYSGDIVFTGDGYDVVWRTNDGMGNSDIRWLHADEATLHASDPVVVATPGKSDPHGGFDPFTNVTVRHMADASLVAFNRYEHDAVLDEDILTCQLATIRNGAPTVEVVNAGGGFFWDDDCRVLDDGKGPLVMRAGKDLSSSEDNPPDLMFATPAPLAAGRGSGTISVMAPEARQEPTLVGTAGPSVLAWADSRSYASGIQNGEVEVYAAPLGADLVTGTNIRFAHSHLIESTSDLRATSIGTNAILVWIDERHGGSIVDPKPEVFLETVWQ